MKTSKSLSAEVYARHMSCMSKSITEVLLVLIDLSQIAFNRELKRIADAEDAKYVVKRIRRTITIKDGRLGLGIRIRSDDMISHTIKARGRL